MILSTLGLMLVAAPMPGIPGTPTLDGRAAAGYAYLHVFDNTQAPRNDGVAFVTQAMAAGGWPLIAGVGSAASPEALERWLDAQPGVVVREIVPGSATARGLEAVPGDILMADWGGGDENAPAVANRATGKGSEFMVVQGSLAGGDFLYCRRRQPGRSGMGRFLDLLARPHYALARYKLYHALGNDPAHGLREDAMYRDVNHKGVFVQINGGLFWLRDDATVQAFGGWSKLNTLPKDAMFHRDDVPITGTMIRERDDVAVWLIEGRIRRLVRSDAGVKRLGGWEVVRVVPNGCVEEMFPKEGRSIP